MEINRKNFRQQLPHLKDAIERAQFFAIDTEFTGLTCNDGSTPYDTPADYFAKMQTNTDGYIIVQFGLTAFYAAATGDGETASAAPTFRYESFNFYVCPQARKQSFRCQGESMAFLNTHNFDFNKLFGKGLSYCELAEANELRAKLADKLAAAEVGAVADGQRYVDAVVPPEEREFLDTVRQSVSDFLDSTEKEITIEHCNAFKRKIVYQMLEQEFAGEVEVSSRCLPHSNIKILVVERKRSSAEEAARQKGKLQLERDNLEDYVGFTTVLMLLSESKKLIIGHNMFFDVLYTMRQFFSVASHSLADFKRVTHKMFPAFLDTKYFCSQDTVKRLIPSSTLGDIYAIVLKKPFAKLVMEPVTDGISYAEIDGQMHDAGYDSYMTGVVFISVALHLGVKPSEMHCRASRLKSLMNKLYITRLADVCYIDLVGKEPQPKRDHVFYITVPDNWKHPQAQQQFRNYGSIYSFWLTPNSAYVALQHREHASVVMQTIQLAEGVTCTPYDIHLMQMRQDAANREVSAPIAITPAESTTSTTTPSNTTAAESLLVDVGNSSRPKKRKSDEIAAPTAAAAAEVVDENPIAAAKRIDRNGADDDVGEVLARPVAVAANAEKYGAANDLESNRKHRKPTKQAKFRNRPIELSRKKGTFPVNDNWI